MEKAVFHFAFAGDPVSCEPYGHGHINRTFLVETTGGKRYILQRINQHVFRDVPAMMDNIIAVTTHLATKSDDPRACLRLVPTSDGAYFFRDEEGEYWRAYDYVENSVCLQTPRDIADFYESAVGLGHFQMALLDFPADRLVETIPRFHDTPDRYRQFCKVLAADPLRRANEVTSEIEFVFSRVTDGARLQQMRDSGELPLRVTHNDTKLNNIMLDIETGHALCVIDLDTVMPGLVAYDFGDSIRFGASTGAEDETDLSKIEMDLSLYETFTQGFLSSCGGLTQEEIRSLPLGAKTMTLECGLRFLTDYLDGDHYFSIARPAHNLDRARTQFKLVADMEEKWDEMIAITEAFLA